MKRISNGFSLLELVTVLSLIGILFFMAFSFSHRFTDGHLLDSRVKSVEDAINYAEHEAVFRKMPVILGPINQDWSQGMRLFISQSDSRTFSEGDTVIRQWNWPKDKLKMSWKGFLSDNYLVFSSRLAYSVLNGRFIIEQTRGNKRYELIINSLGRVRLEKFKS